MHDLKLSSKEHQEKKDRPEAVVSTLLLTLALGRPLISSQQTQEEKHNDVTAATDESKDTPALRLSYNQLTSLSGFSSVFTFTCLKWLDLSHNHIKTIDEVSTTTSNPDSVFTICCTFAGIGLHHHTSGSVLAMQPNLFVG